MDKINNLMKSFNESNNGFIYEKTNIRNHLHNSELYVSEQKQIAQ